MNYSFSFVEKVLRNFAELIKSPVPVKVEQSEGWDGEYIHTQSVRIYLPEIQTHADFLTALGVTAHEVFHAKNDGLTTEQTKRIFESFKRPLQKLLFQAFEDRKDEEQGIQEYPGMAMILPFMSLILFKGRQDIDSYLRLWARSGYATGKLGEWIRRRVRQSRFTKSLSPQLLEKAYAKYVDAYRRRDIDGMIRAIKEVIPDPPETPPKETPQAGSESAENTRDGSIMMNVSLQPLSQKGQKTGPGQQDGEAGDQGDHDAEGEESGEDQREGLADDTPDSTEESSEQNPSEDNPVDEPMDTDDEVVDPGDQDDDSELPQEEFEAEGDIEEPVDEEQRHGDDEGGDSEAEEEEQHPDGQPQEKSENNDPNDPEEEQQQGTINDELMEMEDDPISQEELDQMLRQIEEEASRIVQGLSQGATEISRAIRESVKPKKCVIWEIPFEDRYSSGILMPPERVKTASPSGRISKVYRVAVNISPTYKARIYETGRTGRLLILLDVSGSMGNRMKCPYLKESKKEKDQRIVNASLLVYWVLKASTRAGASVAVLGWNDVAVYEVIWPYRTSIPPRLLVPYPDEGTSMELAYHYVRFLSPSPDIIITITDGIILEEGLYDFVRLAPHSYLVSLLDDKDYFRKYFKRVWVLTDRIPLHEFAQSIIRELNREVL